MQRIEEWDQTFCRCQKGKMMLSLYKLEIFNTVAMEGSFSRAAKRLLLTQPAISQHIRDLESGLQTELFVRGNRGVTLTPAGETLLDYTRCILRMLAEAENAVKNVRQLSEGQVTIGATPGVGSYLLPEWIRVFHERFPALATILRTGTTAAIAGDLLAGRLDLGFVEGELEGEPPLRVLALREISLFVVVGRDHPWWLAQTIGIMDLNGQPFITRPPGSHTRAWVDQVFTRNRVSPQIVAEFDHPEAIKGAVASGMGVAILPDWALERGTGEGRIRALPVTGVNLRRTLKVAWNEDRLLAPPSRAFLAQLSDAFPQLAQAAAFEAELNLDLPRRQDYRASLGACLNP